MGRIVITEFVTLDGVMEAPGGGDFRHAGWSFRVSSGPEGQQYKLDEVMDAQAQLLGRVTYEEFAAAWPTMEGTGAFGEKMNGMPKYVVSSSLRDAAWTNTTIVGGDVVEAVSRVKREVDGTILVAGSAQLVQALIANDLADELRLMVHPIVLGEGKRLFGSAPDAKQLSLTSSRTLGDGVQLLVYERA